jgi:hypothetical protein
MPGEGVFDGSGRGRCVIPTGSDGVGVDLDPGLGSWGRKITVSFGRDYARVELNRDSWMDRVRGVEEEISQEFQASVDRCRKAGIDRIWLDGGTTRGFLWGSGSRWVTLFVPIRLAKEAVEALRYAETRGEFSRLDRLTGKMAAPFDDWLAPGERYLARGAAFACPPSQFLIVLRAEARGRGLRLNGRADRGGVWVRPTRSSTERLLREAFPERYESGPDPYADGDRAPSRRPPEPGRARRRSPGTSSPVRFLHPPQR